VKAKGKAAIVARFKIDGTWEGEYSYHQKRDGPEVPPPVRFTLTARGGWFGAFEGTIQDDPTQANPEPAGVRGRVSGTTLNFTKQYPEMYIHHEGRSIPLAEFLESEKGLVVDGKVRGVPIHYEGDYDEAEERVTGIWWLAPGTVHIRSRGKLVTINRAGGSGRWMMRRVQLD
jgi:hypothetical protein